MDNRENIWVATQKGIAKYDGQDWVLYDKTTGLINNKTNAIVADSKGNIWIGTKKGISVFDGQNWKTHKRGDGLINNVVLDIMEDINGNMWFATKTGVSVFDGKNWKSFTKSDGLARNFVMSMADEKNGEIWFGTLNGAFSSFDGSDWEQMKQGAGYFNFAMIGVGVANGVAWTLLLGPVVGGTIFILNVALGAAPSQPAMVYIDSNDNIWLAAQPKGVFMSEGGNWMLYNKKNGLPHNRVNSMLKMSDGDMWFGTYKGIAIMNSP
jgi:ligand-binding sensor domain-containing protein